MPQIVRLKTMYCGRSTSDKVYGVAVVKADNGFYSLYTFYGPRGKVLNTRLIETAAGTSGLFYDFQGIVRDKSRKYDDINWKDAHYGLEATVRSLGTPPGESVEPVVAAPVVTPNRKPAKQAPATTVPDNSRSFGLIRDI